MIETVVGQVLDVRDSPTRDVEAARTPTGSVPASSPPTEQDARVH
jgi:hypothetical protein